MNFVSAKDFFLTVKYMSQPKQLVSLIVTIVVVYFLTRPKVKAQFSQTTQMDRAMEKERFVGLTIIGIFEYLVGLVWSFLLVLHLADSMAFGKKLTTGAGLVIFIAWSLFLLLGIGVLRRNKISLVANRVIIPIMLFIQIVTLIGSGIGFPFKGGIIFISVSVSLIVIGISILAYLSRPKVKEQFR